MKTMRLFWNNESGAVTVDWVVITSSIVGISIAVMLVISGGLREASNEIWEGLDSVGSYDFTRKDAKSYFDIGIAANPDNQRDAWLTARLAVDGDAPAGYNYDPNMTTTRYVEDGSALPIYISDDGTNYSIGGKIIAVDDYDASQSTSFKGTFDQYWDASN